MAYQTLPNTFASGSTIYSTAVSANMVALLQGYTTGTYDLWGNDLAVKEISVKSGKVYLGSGGTGVFSGAVTVAGTFVGSGSVEVAGSAAVTGDLTVTGDVLTTTYTTWTPAFANSIITKSAGSGGYYRVGKTVYCDVYIMGTATGSDVEIINLPVTASASETLAFSDRPILIVSGGTQVPGMVRPVAGNLYAIVAPSYTSFVTAAQYTIAGTIVYRGE